MSDLFESSTAKTSDYSADDIEVLEGLEPVRRRPGMYIGGTDERAVHHLVAEVLDNAMDEAVAGHASRIDIEMDEQDFVSVRDNGRGIPIDEHPKFPGKSALEVILTTLHSGGKFSDKAYHTAGGLHGVGLSVVNALADHLSVEVARDRQLYTQNYSRGLPQGPISHSGGAPNRRGTLIRFHPDPEIFGAHAKLKPSLLYKMARSKAYLFKGVEIRWRVADGVLPEDSKTPKEDTLHFPNGLTDYINASLEGEKTISSSIFSGETDFPDGEGRVEWAIAWPQNEEGFSHYYCNTIPTPQGGTHEAGLRGALNKGLKAFGEMSGVKKASSVTADDILGGAMVMVSVFIRDPQFQGQTKEKLTSASASKWVEQAIRDRFEHYLSSDPASANELIEVFVAKAEARKKRRADKETARKSATRRLRLPGKLADCTREGTEDTELFLVEGDSAGGSAKQARNRETQAVLALRGKILNVASATTQKMDANKEIADIVQALGCGIGKNFNPDSLRYGRVVIMTDADVDGAHIASLLITFFYQQMPRLIEQGRLYIAQPPLYRLNHKGKTIYARDEAHKDTILETEFKNSEKVEISRFKGLGEMMPAQLKETTMNPASRSLLRVMLPLEGDIEMQDDLEKTKGLVDDLMGKKPEKRFQFIQQNACFVDNIDI